MINDSQLSPEELGQRAARAEQLLQDPLMQEAFANLRIQYFEEWLNTQPADSQAREALYMAARAVQHVEGHFHVVLARRPIEGKLDSLKKVQAVRRDSLRREGPQRAGNVSDVATL